MVTTGYMVVQARISRTGRMQSHANKIFRFVSVSFLNIAFPSSKYFSYGGCMRCSLLSVLVFS